MLLLDDGVAAIQGKSIPPFPMNEVTICCLVRGIRYRDGFAQDLHGNPKVPMVTRSLNARAIMSNRVPAMTAPDHFPYCFWHPDVPQEETLRQLLARYPGNDLMRYQVGRACAAGGYTSLYHELCLLPDVGIAEEARDNLESGHAIYKAIMDATKRYSYMDDYNLCLRPQPLPGAYLNGDTCVRSILDKKQPLSEHGLPPFLEEVVFDITEDRCIGINGTKPLARPVDPQAIALLYTPLPADLPTVDKDLLILLAAWSGNIDRYARLRRPKEIPGEMPCIVRGIHHHPLFAKWWLTQPSTARNGFIQRAIHSRCVMNNDLSWLSDSTPDSDLPDLIWYPQVAHKATYRELMRRRPSMVAVVARACIHADYEDLFASLDAIPIDDADLIRDAQISQNRCYEEYFQRKANECGIDLEQLVEYETQTWTGPRPHIMLDQDRMTPGCGYGTQVMELDREVTLDHVGFQPQELATTTSTIGHVLLHACVADPSMRPSIPYRTLNLVKLYTQASAIDEEGGQGLAIGDEVMY
ncbi:hypothetical protein BJX68DRAFT_266263 [Aspergillus pseudodeflectus]|uniref:Uncharacterized protein n=1 Tax=Aspergillus pseudodeflectus TaxID=176178 RepID=A0ABR4KJ85_9EURO